jgi:hypothetical protein
VARNDYSNESFSWRDKEIYCNPFTATVWRQNKTPVLAAKNRGLDRSMSQRTREYLATHCIEIITGINGNGKGIRYFLAYDVISDLFGGNKLVTL